MATQQPHDMLNPFDSTSGNGSSSKEESYIDRESIFSNEWGSQAATTFNPNEAPPDKKEHFEELYAQHNGKGERDRSVTITQSHITNDAKTFMSILELPQYQRKRVLNILERMDISSNNFGPGKRYEKIILTICSLVADEELSRRPDASLDDRLFLTDEFSELMETTDMTSAEHNLLRRKIRQQSEYF